MERLKDKLESMDSLKSLLKHTRHGAKSAYDALREPEVEISNFDIDLSQYSQSVIEEVALDAKYAGYLKRQEVEAERAKKQENMEIPLDFDYDKVDGLSSESREKFKTIRPASIGQAGRISGVRVSDVAILSMAVKGAKR